MVVCKDLCSYKMFVFSVCVRERERDGECVCVWRERESSCVCIWERGEKKVCVCVCVCVCVQEREEKHVTEIERGVMYVCVTVCQRETKWYGHFCVY